MLALQSNLKLNECINMCLSVRGLKRRHTHIYPDISNRCVHDVARFSTKHDWQFPWPDLTEFHDQMAIQWNLLFIFVVFIKIIYLCIFVIVPSISYIFFSLQIAWWIWWIFSRYLIHFASFFYSIPHPDFSENYL